MVGEPQNDFINFKQGFLDELDVFEEVKEDWSEADGQNPFTGCTHSAMALQVLGNWEPLPREVNDAIGGMMGGALGSLTPDKNSGGLSTACTII